jgi:DNA-binding NarL/FixJ family response regulator
MTRVAAIGSDVEYLRLLADQLSKNDAIEIVYTGRSNDNIVKTLTALGTSVILFVIAAFWDKSLKEMHDIRKSVPQAKILLLTTLENANNVLEAIKAGASGCLLKTDHPQKIIEAIYNVVDGDKPLNAKVARFLVDYCVSDGEQVVLNFGLTKREKEIFDLLLDGLSYKIICHKCSISLNTLFTHTRKLYRKVLVHSRSELSAKFKK